MASTKLVLYCLSFNSLVLFFVSTPRDSSSFIHHEYGTCLAISLCKEKSSPTAVLGEDDSPRSHTNEIYSNRAIGDTSGSSAKDLNSLSNCEPAAAADGDLTQAEVTDCYRQVFECVLKNTTQLPTFF